ncbi:LLM class F420-dependent oxidoreductase [Agrococcus sp. ARC_14]|uniref:LLM class F420-dependent oxidoreductase n=1 Tax=Agrococcus sp. ARC_14 TaxID=2919927 RepID=UPI001F069E19|nr:LLM class F420-dependent oxidoreductase [Agrococcus sp. ARC_14]MCH1881404.1 LLM class F420-dependent oxidoreductase [Agrococcus sp. ARC_14]
MRVGVHLPQWGAGANRSAVIDLAQAAEESGFDSVWVADHIVLPVESNSDYPYRGSGTPFAPEDGFLEGLTMLAAVAGATTKVGLGTSVLVLPMRHPLEVAKIASTIDLLSDGRLQLAVGAGWMREEFDALDQRFDARGRRMDEQIEIMRLAWTKGIFAYSGEFYDFPELACLPLPVQPSGPPLLIGGLGPTAFRRIKRHGDGWQVLGADFDALTEMRTRLDELGPGKILSTSTGMPRTAEKAINRLRSLAAAGVDQVVLNSIETPADLLARLQMYRDEVFPAVST